MVVGCPMLKVCEECPGVPGVHHPQGREELPLAPGSGHKARVAEPCALRGSKKFSRGASLLGLGLGKVAVEQGRGWVGLGCIGLDEGSSWLSTPHSLLCSPCKNSTRRDNPCLVANSHLTLAVALVGWRHRRGSVCSRKGEPSCCRVPSGLAHVHEGIGKVVGWGGGMVAHLLDTHLVVVVVVCAKCSGPSGES